MPQVDNGVQVLGEVDQVLLRLRSDMDLGVDAGLDMGPTLKLGVDNQVFQSNCVDLIPLFDIAVLITGHHVVEDGVHILSEEVLVICLQVERFLV